MRSCRDLSIFVGTGRSLKSHNCAMQDAQLATDRSKAVVLCNSCFMLFDVGVSGHILYYIVGFY